MVTPSTIVYPKVGIAWIREREREAAKLCNLADGSWFNEYYDFNRPTALGNGNVDFLTSSSGTGTVNFSIAANGGVHQFATTTGAGTYVLYMNTIYIVLNPGTNPWYMYARIAIPSTSDANTRAKIEMEAGASNKRVGMGVYGDGSTTKYVARITGTSDSTDIVSTVTASSTFATLRMWAPANASQVFFKVDDEAAQGSSDVDDLEAGNYYWRFGQDQAGAGVADQMNVDVFGIITTRH